HAPPLVAAAAAVSRAASSGARPRVQVTVGAPAAQLATFRCGCYVTRMDILATPATIALAILALGVLIIVHEGGHFLVARLSGMRVDRFSIGFGPKLFSFKRGETVYQIAAIPLGGFVQIAGLNPGDDGMTADDPRAYPNRPVWQRLATIFAGP